MSYADPFEVLGLDRKTASETDVKRAYAKLLKETRPDDDPEGFMQLRTAFTQARAQAKYTVVAEQDADISDPKMPDLNTETIKEPGQAEPVRPEPEEEVRHWFDEKLNYHFNSSPYGQLIERFIRWMKRDTSEDPDVMLSELADAPALRDPQTYRQFQEFLLNTIFWDANTAEYFDDDDPDAVPEFSRPDWLTDPVILLIQKHFDLLGYLPEELWQGHRVNVTIALFTPALTKAGILVEQPDMHDTLNLFEQDQTKFRKDDHGSYFDRNKKQWIDMSPVSVAMRDIEALVKAHPWGAPPEEWKAIVEREALQTIDEHQDLSSRLATYICQETGYWREIRTPENPSWLKKDILLTLDDAFGWNHSFGRQTYERRQYDWLHQMIRRYRLATENSNGFQTQYAHFQPTVIQDYNKPGMIYIFFSWMCRPWGLFVAYILYRAFRMTQGEF